MLRSGRVAVPVVLALVCVMAGAGCGGLELDLFGPDSRDVPYYALSVPCRQDGDCPRNAVCDPDTAHCTLVCLVRADCRLLEAAGCAAVRCEERRCRASAPTGCPDAGPPDAGLPDAGLPDAGPPDATTAEPAEPGEAPSPRRRDHEA